MTQHFVKMTITDFRKNENRVLTFLEKIKSGETFGTVNKGSKVTIAIEEYDEVMVFLQADGGKFPAARSSTYVKTSNGRLKIPNDFTKTGDLGGGGKGSGYAAETLAMNDFNKKLETLLMYLGKSSVPLIVGKPLRTVECAKMVKTEGNYNGKDPKSDMTIVDVSGKPVAYISHKAGRNASSYQQYGGVSKAALPSTYHNNSEIKSFMDKVLELKPEGLLPTNSFYRKIKDKKLASISVYGPKFGQLPGISNVDEFHLGNMNLYAKTAKKYIIQSIHKGTNGAALTGDYTPILFIRYNARVATAAGVSIPFARVGIFNMAKVPRTSKEI